MCFFLKETVECIQKLEAEGISILTKDGLQYFPIKLAQGILDTVARAPVLGFYQYNKNEGGCHTCTIKPDIFEVILKLSCKIKIFFFSLKKVELWFLTVPKNLLFEIIANFAN